MYGLDFFVPIALFSFSSAITPGPNNLIVVTASVHFGFLRTLPAVFGVCIGFAAMTLVVNLGLGPMFVRYPLMHDFLRAASLAFILYIAWKMATADITDNPRAAPPSFWQMAAFQWVNPKAWAANVAGAAAFTRGLDPMVEAVLITGVFFATTLPSVLSWCAFGVAIGDFLRAVPLRLRVFNISMALLMVGVFVPVMLVN